MLRVVNIADMLVSASSEDVLITHALGSCIGLAVYDPVIKAGGLLHAMLPFPLPCPGEERENIFMFLDSGVPALFHALYNIGAKKERIIVSAAGGACVSASSADMFQIGSRNVDLLRKLLEKNNITLSSHDLGGEYARTMSLDILSGKVSVRRNNRKGADVSGGGL